MRSVDDYLALIPPLNANKPNFRAVIAATVAPFADAQTFLANLPAQFDLGTAIGVQLDTVGLWVGRTRNVPVPVVQRWFSWDTTGLGWDQAPWQGPQILATVNFPLDDTTYRRLLRAKIAANYSDGSVGEAQAALTTYFLSPTLIFVTDNGVAIGIEQPPRWFTWDGPQNEAWDFGVWKPLDQTAALDSLPNQSGASLSWTIGVSGTLPDAVDLYILAQNLIPVQPAGVHVDIEVTTVDGSPLFGFDVENQYVSGWDIGAWGASPEYVVQNIL